MVGWLDEHGGGTRCLWGCKEEVTPGITGAEGVADNYEVISCFLHRSGREPIVKITGSLN